MFSHLFSFFIGYIIGEKDGLNKGNKNKSNKLEHAFKRSDDGRGMKMSGILLKIKKMNFDDELVKIEISQFVLKISGKYRTEEFPIEYEKGTDTLNAIVDMYLSNGYQISSHFKDSAVLHKIIVENKAV